MSDKPKKADTAAADPTMIPANVRAGQVISLVEITGGLGPLVDVSTLADELGADIAVLLPILDAAEMLGLVKNEKGVVSLTDFGLRFQNTSKQKVRLVRERLSGIEPFKTALELARKKGEIEASDVAEAISQTGYKWHHYEEMNASLVQGLLIHWAIHAGLLTYDGRNGKFRLVS